MFPFNLTERGGKNMRTDNEIIAQTDVYDIETEEVFSIKASDFKISSTYNWVCPACKKINEEEEEPQFDSIDVFECNNCGLAIELDK